MDKCARERISPMEFIYTIYEQSYRRNSNIKSASASHVFICFCSKKGCKKNDLHRLMSASISPILFVHKFFIYKDGAPFCFNSILIFMSITTTETARIFVTDYASYNNGTQFEFGHWVDLDDFSDAEELEDYIKNHFEECDRKSPLGFGSIREELMITDFEGFPRNLYAESNMDFEALYDYLALNEEQQCKVAFLIEDNQTFEYAMEHYEDVYISEDHGRRTHLELFSERYPEADAADDKCEYLEINYDRFIKEEFTEFSFNGIDYLVENRN